MKKIVESPIHFAAVRQGYLAIGHRPQRKALAGWRERQGLTHLWTLLSTHEGCDKLAESAANGCAGASTILVKEEISEHRRILHRKQKNEVP